MNKTYIPKQADIKQQCYLIDATDKILGRVATKVAAIVRGKHKPIFTPHLDTGDMVIVINADKIKVTGRKMEQKVYSRYSGYPSGRREVKLADMLKKRPAQVLTLAVNRMIQKGPLGNKLRTRFRIYAGDKHGHQAQKPIKLEI